MAYASVDEMRSALERLDVGQAEGSDEGMQDNPLYQSSGSTFSTDAKPRAPPTAPKPGVSTPHCSVQCQCRHGVTVSEFI